MAAGDRRVPPLSPGEYPEELRPVLERRFGESGQSLGDNNIFSTLARHPALMKAWLPFGGALLWGGELPARDRELLILRTAVNCTSDYEWGQHVRIGLDAGLSREEVDRVPAGPGAAGWSEHDALLLRVADELHATSDLRDETWASLSERYDEHQLIEVPLLVGHYHMVAFALNTFGVPLDDGLEALPAA